MREWRPTGQSSRGLANAHVHLPPNFSAFASVEQAVEMAQSAGLRLLGASNYYDYAVYEPFVEQCLDAGIYPLLGIEIVCMDEGRRDSNLLVNDPGNPGKTYVCGKGAIGVFDPEPSAENTLRRIREQDALRIEEMADALDGIFLHANAVEGYWDASRISQVLAVRYGVEPGQVWLQERHLALAYQEALFEAVAENRRAEVLRMILGAASSDPNSPSVVQAEIRSALLKASKPAFAPEEFVSLSEGLELVAGLQGLPVYPVVADGMKPASPTESDADSLIGYLRSEGFLAAEFIPNRNTPEVLEPMVLALDESGFVVTAGTEHNTLDLVPIVPECRDGSPIPESCQEVFWRGACVLAAHQHRVLSAKPGYAGERAEFETEGRELLGG